jgi:hypothetical protein
MRIMWGYRATLDPNDKQITTYKQYVGTARY